ncbi:hypothetical protein PILCRDRAFT_824814 [Piloderma croceum F 1598]|uniref:Uncharacterized protein n=1 Tax=Piloderma croceum (strain F 1598) TaxID=765440 RepID=A0A0C3F021_PILCF|nr:hypothetical protein PILCRDRAFT_824814 [Piloderma croceum F 1598]
MVRNRDQVRAPRLKGPNGLEGFTGYIWSPEGDGCGTYLEDVLQGARKRRSCVQTVTGAQASGGS